MSLEKEFEENIELRVLLLGLFKKEEDETFNDILGVMEGSRVFAKKIGKKYLKNLKELNYISDDGFTMIGITKAKEVEMEFKI
ncbi:MAG: hypothetical protein U9N59_05465 [Campylobacterota bacterium]|nr:hypothetical protein [Campylobacterota bacterium]